MSLSLYGQLTSLKAMRIFLLNLFLHRSLAMRVIRQGFTEEIIIPKLKPFAVL